jgi:hypothetical protein
MSPISFQLADQQGSQYVVTTMSEQVDFFENVRLILLNFLIPGAETCTGVKQ